MVNLSLQHNCGNNHKREESEHNRACTRSGSSGSAGGGSGSGRVSSGVGTTSACSRGTGGGGSGGSTGVVIGTCSSWNEGDTSITDRGVQSERSCAENFINDSNQRLTSGGASAVVIWKNVLSPNAHIAARISQAVGSIDTDQDL
jgi:hypothetical protein